MTRLVNRGSTMARAFKNILAPPYSLEAEASVLGAVLLRPATLEEVADILNADDFYREAHVHIYQAMLYLRGQGAPVDIRTVAELLKERGHLQGLGGPDKPGEIFLGELSDRVGIAANAGYYAQIVRDKAIQRHLLERAQKIVMECQKPVDRIDDLLDFWKSQALEINDIGRRNGDGHARQIIQAKELLARKYSSESEVISKGILPVGGGCIIAGESGDGKSLLRSELATNLSMGRGPWGLEVPKALRVLVFQFENTEATEAYRLKKMLLGLEIKNFPENLTFSDPTIRLDLGRRQDRSRALGIIKESGAQVVIFDPLTSLHSVNENDNVQIRKILDHITEINRKAGTTAILIHHFGKPTENSITAHRTRGGSSIRDWADTLIAVTRKKHEHKTLRLLEFIKVRNGPEPKPILLERDENFLHHVTDDDVLCPPEKVKAIIEGLGGKVEGQSRLREAIMEVTNCGDRSARAFIDLAIERGVVRYEANPTDRRKKIYAV